MNWFYHDGSKQVGPVSEADVRAALAAGILRPDSLVWRQGMANWQPLRDVLPANALDTAGAPFVAGVPPTQSQCCECRNCFAVEDMLQHGELYVCGGCKPIFLQRIREGLGAGSGGARIPGGVTESQVRARDYELSVGDLFSGAWRTFKKNPGIIIGVTALVGLCLSAINILPYANIVLPIVLTGPLLGGYYSFFLKNIRSQPTAVGDAFSGFGPRFGQLLLGNFVPGILSSLAMIPGGAFLLFGGLALAMSGGNSGGGAMTASSAIIMMTGAGLMLLALPAVIYLSVCWFFTLWLVVDKNMAFWPAMGLSRAVVRKHWWVNLLILLLCGISFAMGVVFCLVGALVTVPVAAGVCAHAYEKLFGDMHPA
jgi:hypothetical protein